MKENWKDEYLKEPEKELSSLRSLYNSSYITEINDRINPPEKPDEYQIPRQVMMKRIKRLNRINERQTAEKAAIEAVAEQLENYKTEDSKIEIKR